MYYRNHNVYTLTYTYIGFLGYDKSLRICLHSSITGKCWHFMFFPAHSGELWMNNFSVSCTLESAFYMNVTPKREGHIASACFIWVLNSWQSKLAHNQILKNEQCFLWSIDAGKQDMSFWMSEVSMESYPTYACSEQLWWDGRTWKVPRCHLRRYSFEVLMGRRRRIAE